MKKIDDSKLYFYFALTTLIIGIILAVVSFYSIYSVEPEIKDLLASAENKDKSYERAYILLRDPQIFARYEHFDTEQDLQLGYSTAKKLNIDSQRDLEILVSKTFPGTTVKKALRYFDNKVYYGKEITADEKRYLEVLLDRRMKGARLGRNTMIFVLVVSMISWILLFVEKRRVVSFNSE